MQRHDGIHIARSSRARIAAGQPRVGWTIALALLGALGPGRALAQGASPLSDTWPGDKLDPRWHFTVLGDAQGNESSVKVENGALRLRAGGSNWWDDIDDGMFVWQPANGDFVLTLELRGIKRTSTSSKIGLAVRTSLDQSAPNVFCAAMPKGGQLQERTEYGGSTGPFSGCPGAECNPWGDPNTSDLGNQPTILQRLTRTGSVFKAERSYDGGQSWVGLRTGSLAVRDIATVDMPDDVLVGIVVSASNSTALGSELVTEAVVGPFIFTQTASRPTDNGLVAATATDSGGTPVPDVGLIVKRGNEVVGTSVGTAAVSDTTSFFLKPGAYTIETAESVLYQASTPIPFEIRTGKIQALKVAVGKAK